MRYKKEIFNILILAGVCLAIIIGVEPAMAALGGPASEITSRITTGSSFQISAQFGDLVFNLINIFLFILGALAGIALIYGGILYSTAAGNESNAENGKKTVMYAMIGIVVVVTAFLILNLAFRSVDELRMPFQNNWVEKAYAIPTLREIVGGEDRGALYNDLDQVAINVRTQINWFYIYGFIAAFVAILYAGYLYLTAYGDSSKAEKAKKILIFVVIGIMFMLLGAGLFRGFYTGDDLFNAEIQNLPTP